MAKVIWERNVHMCFIRYYWAILCFSRLVMSDGPKNGRELSISLNCAKIAVYLIVQTKMETIFLLYQRSDDLMRTKAMFTVEKVGGMSFGPSEKPPWAGLRAGQPYLVRVFSRIFPIYLS